MAEGDALELTLLDAGITVREGQYVTLPAFNVLQRSVTPVFAEVDDRMCSIGRKAQLSGDGPDADAARVAGSGEG
jgi:hypothetical protein